jgi:hypothetical protein
LALALFRLSLLLMVHRTASETPLRRFARRCDTHQADTRRVLLVCACTHYLVFKEPEPAFSLAAARSGTPPISRKRPNLGEPSKVTSAHYACQPFFRCRTAADAAVDRSWIVEP